MSPNNIKALRLLYGVTQEQFARLIGATTVTINRWEMGKSSPSNPYLKEMKQLLVNYGINSNQPQTSENTGTSLRADCDNDAVSKDTAQCANSIG